MICKAYLYLSMWYDVKYFIFCGNGYRGHGLSRKDDWCMTLVPCLLKRRVYTIVKQTNELKINVWLVKLHFYDNPLLVITLCYYATNVQAVK